MKTFWKILLWIVTLVTVTLLAFIVYHYQLKAAVTNYRAQLKTWGEPTDLAQVLPPPVAPEQNSAELLLKAYVLLVRHESVLSTNPPYGEMVAPGKAVVIAQQPDFHELGKYGFTNSWTDMQAAVDDGRQSLDVMREIIRNPKLDFHIPYGKGFAHSTFFTNEHLVEQKKSASFASCSALIELHRGNIPDAITNVRVALAIVAGMEDQRTAIAQLVRFAIASNARNSTWEILQSEHLKDDELGALQNDWSRLGFIHSYKNALLMEWVVGDRMLMQWRKSDAELEKFFGIYDAAYKSLGMDDEEKPKPFQRLKMSSRIFMWRYWWSYPDELRSLRGMEVLMETARRVETNSPFGPSISQQEAALGALKLDFNIDPFSKPNLHSMLSESVVSLGPLIKRVMAAETMKRMAVTAIALKRYQLRHGHYPEQLAELTPDYISSATLDPVDGKLLRYRLNADGSFTLYSVGPNGKDDGGNPSLENGAEPSSIQQWQDRHALDWVWPQPATQAEIQKYYADQAKKSD